MKSISLNITKAASFLAEGAVKAYEPKVKAAQEALENGTCEGNDFLGWLHLPSSITPEFLNEIQAVANTLREKCEVVVVAGIGGSSTSRMVSAFCVMSSMVLVIAPEPSVVARPATVGACQTRAQLSTLGLSNAHLAIFWKR